MFLSQTLKNGHNQTVTCIACTQNNDNNANEFISGSELGEVCFWSATDGRLVKKLRLSVWENDDIMCIKCSVKNPEQVFVSASHKVIVYDLKYLDKPLQELSFAEDEINEISLNGEESHLAAAEDSGNIKVFDLRANKLMKTLRNHENICSGVSFRPNRAAELLSCSFDQKLIHWEYLKSKSFCILNMQEVGAQPDDEENYLVNPPFIHSLSVNCSGSLVACGTENALVQVFDGSKKILRHVKTLRKHHRGVAQVHSLLFAENLLLSAGNDNLLCLWELNNISQNIDYSRTNGNHLTANHNSRNRSQSTNERTPLWQMNHSESFNWLSSGISGNSKFLLVADNSTEPLVFTYAE
ncbi:hypothetical protein HELRODRAFT_92232 [Helobdella robusta]|uniref:Uncharacterized protein n=1 Tax=Helobdella robusta TaxID=6412 RepID=T1G8D3_HELRO|nr:hypothetical protein HELRODRAFT_92232 [Helobdella robusta]ESO09659.1 hypothetical protein HELRODRAFT_92232 [Helobdella robusta]